MFELAAAVTSSWPARTGGIRPIRRLELLRSRCPVSTGVAIAGSADTDTRRAIVDEPSSASLKLLYRNRVDADVRPALRAGSAGADLRSATWSALGAAANCRAWATNRPVRCDSVWV